MRMSRLKTFWSRVAALFRRRKLDGELDEELRAHLEMATEENRRRGMREEEARLKALRDFGGVTQVREAVRLREGWPWVENLRRDVGYALRQMRKDPGFAAVVVVTLALGIGAATAMFTVVEAVLLRPVAYRDAGRLVTILVGDEQGAFNVTWLDIEEWQKESRSFEQMAFSGGMSGRNYLHGKTDLLEVSGRRVTANLFSTLGVQPELGRGFLPEGPSFAPGKNAGTIVLSDAVWRTAFGADRSILGGRSGSTMVRTRWLG
jgi:hypothetical protein